MRHDPLANPEPLIRRIYAYVAYRIGDGPEAEDVVSATFERALRYCDTFDPRRGEPIAWLVGIAKHCMNDAFAAREPTHGDVEETPSLVDVETTTIRRLTLEQAMARLGERDQELLALRYGADLSARAIADLVGAKTNAVEVAVHRALARLRVELTRDEEPPGQVAAVALSQVV